MLKIINGRVIDPVCGTIESRDIFVKNGIIASGPDFTADRVIDASGLYIAPGLVDIHVHFREPGYEYKEDILSGAEAAAAGGFTTVACMANTKPVIDTPDLVTFIKNSARKAKINVLPIGAVTMGQQGISLSDFAALKEAGACALSDDGMPIANARLMLEALKAADELGLLIIAHSEDASLTDGRAVNEGELSRKLGIEGRPAVAEEYMIMRDAMLAEYARAGVHIAHISTANSVEIIRNSKLKGIDISCETCPQYFMFTEEEVLTKGSMAKMYPPLRTKKDRDAIIAGLADGTIEIIATDHAPHSSEEKAKSIIDSPGGIIGLETSLAAALTALYHTGRLGLIDIIRKMSLNPAARLKLPSGGVSTGDRADLVIFDPEREWLVDTDKLHSKSVNTPFAGMKLKGRVEYTICNGSVVYEAEDR